MGDAKVYPVNNNKFKVGLNGLKDTMTMIANLTNFAPSIEGGVEEWNAMEHEGWGDAMMTSKKLSFSFQGKRTYGDPGNDYVAGLAWKSGNDVVAPFEWEMPSGAKVTCNSIINVTTPAGGDSTAADALEFEVKCKGKPTFTAASAGSGE
ncbi:hypothetical protein BXY41_10875 [Lacrimispora xylanisolvens]|uniref:TP901-1 family phage major tail protein n=1 Tax=Lacrimispora xylanisolvens TaxID=384636 RepID=A0A2S6HQG3_9FIRM|nr:hypothetical protein [Hungatella xylanolytica]PPK79850.1 hypothetical protein BXY41_10875 [Hungatella xylanolytica]